MVDSILATGLKGVQQGLESASQNAARLTNAFVSGNTDQATDAIIGLKIDEFQVKASSKIIQTADELQKSVLDILA